jgi:UDP-N-acetylglucosamine 2-epimerase
MECGAGILAGTTQDSILSAYYNVKNLPVTWRQPFGDGNSSERIYKDLEKRISEKENIPPWVNKRISRGWIK